MSKLLPNSNLDLPSWEGLIESHVKWKVRVFQSSLVKVGYEIQDGIQEGWLTYLDCCRRYKNVATTQAHFRCLFKIVFNCHILDIVKHKSSKLDYYPELMMESLNKKFMVNEGNLRVLLREMPKEIERFLGVVFNTPTELVTMLGLDSPRRRGFLNNKVICSFLGYNYRLINLPKLVKNYFS